MPENPDASVSFAKAAALSPVSGYLYFRKTTESGVSEVHSIETLRAAIGVSDLTVNTVGVLFNGAVTITSPADVDIVPVTQSSVVKKITWANIKAALKAYFDSLYATAAQGTKADNALPTASYTTESIWGKINKVLYAVNLDTVITPGMYRVESCSGLPVAQDYGQLLVVAGGGDTISQTFYDWWDCQTYIRVGTFFQGVMTSRYGWRRIPKPEEIPSVMLGNTSLQLIRTYPIMMTNTLVDITSNAYGFAYAVLGTLGAGITYLLEIEASITIAATSAGYVLGCIVYNNPWTYSQSIMIYDSVVKKWFFEFTPNATEVINIGFWQMPNSGARQGSCYVKFWRLWKKY